jgi:signal peptide peptidase SppA
MERRAFDLLRAESAVWASLPELPEALAAAFSAGELPRRAAVDRRPPAPLSTAIVPVVGPLVRRGGFLASLLGLSSYATIRAQLAQAVADRSVDRILLFVDSPGGSAQGVQEVFADVLAAGKVKKTIAYVENAASAAYWIASAASEITATVSAEVGSIGVFGLHLSFAGALEQAGVEPTYIVSRQSPHKTDGNPHEPLSAEAKAEFQRDVDRIAANFIADVARGRRLVSTSDVIKRFGGGRTLPAPEALRAGMIDRVSSMADALSTTTTFGNPRAAARARRLEILRRA